MNRIKQLLSRLMINAGQSNTAPPVKLHSACNYSACNYDDNYYGDQRCEQIVASKPVAKS